MDNPSKNQQVEDGDPNLKSKVEPSASQKLQIRRTERAKKVHKPPPTYTVGELFPWKGIWFQLAQITEDQAGTKLLVITPKTDLS